MENPSELKFTIAFKESIDGGLIGFIKELPGVISQGENIEELTANLTDAIASMFEYNRATATLNGEEYTEQELMSC